MESAKSCARGRVISGECHHGNGCQRKVERTPAFAGVPGRRTGSPVPDPALRRLNWGCGPDGVPGWLNSDVKSGPGIDLSADILDGLPLAADSIDYVVSIHALPELPYSSLLPALEELRRVLKPGGVLRLALPDLLKGVDAYRRGYRDYFLIPDEDMESLGGKLVLQLVWYGYSRTPFVYEFIEELLRRAGFAHVHESAYGQTGSPFEGITELDNRKDESLFVEAVK
jgi:SAM-dependent methyltransferase